MNYAGACCSGAGAGAAALFPAGDASDAGDDSEWWAVGVISGLTRVSLPLALLED